jgi:DNA-binding transcriptional LysR family regulator
MHLASAVADFLAAHPAIELQLHTDDRFVDVVDGGFDVVIRIARLRDSALVARRLASDRLVAVAAPAYLARHGTPEVPADLVGHNCLRYALLPTTGEWRFAGPQGEQAVPVQGNFVANDGTVLREAAVAGIGIAVLPSFMVAADVAAERLRVILAPWCRHEAGIWALLAHRRHLPARVRRFVDFLVARFAGATLGVPVAALSAGRARRRPTAARSTGG